MRIRDRAAFDTQDMTGQGPANAPFVPGCRGCHPASESRSTGIENIIPFHFEQSVGFPVVGVDAQDMPAVETFIDDLPAYLLGVRSKG